MTLMPMRRPSPLRLFEKQATLLVPPVLLGLAWYFQDEDTPAQKVRRRDDHRSIGSPRLASPPRRGNRRSELPTVRTVSRARQLSRCAAPRRCDATESLPLGPTGAEALDVCRARPPTDAGDVPPDPARLSSKPARSVRHTSAAPSRKRQTNAPEGSTARDDRGIDAARRRRRRRRRRTCRGS